MLIDVPYEAIARDAMDGKRVAVFCDGQNQLKMHKRGVAAAAKRMGTTKVTHPMHDRRVDVDGNSVRFLIANGIDGRGLTADIVYLSESARMQVEFAHLMGATIR